jgi:formate-dependent nitrite reductase membrane component NrfD
MGPNAHLFWIGFVLIGFLIPLGFEIALLARIERRETGSAFMVLPACCVLFGGFAIRACIVMAGECSPIYFMLGV